MANRPNDHAKRERVVFNSRLGSGTARVETPVEYGWDHSLGEIVTALIGAGLRIDFLHEFDFLRWQLDWLVQSPDGRWRLPPDSAGQLPLSFSLKATKPGR